MTLILELYDAKNSVGVFISDCMITSRGSQDLRPNFFPLHRESGWSIDTRGVGLSSKAIVSEKKILLCAGFVSNIEAVAVEFNAGRILEFQDFLDSFYAEKAITEAFIYSSLEEGGVISANTNCETLTMGKIQAAFGGTGGKYFKLHFSGRTPDPSFHVFQLGAEVIAMLMRLEFIDYNFPMYDFGGAYEMMRVTQEGPQRVPYAVLDVVGDSDLGEGGVYDLRNARAKRLVLSIPHQDGCMFPVLTMDGESSSASIYDVRQLDRENGRILSEAEVWSVITSFGPEFTIVLIRHSDVNYVITADMLFTIEAMGESGIDVQVDMSAVHRLIETWVPEYKP